MFDRVRVCTLCFRIYKELENYYFKELRRNIPGGEEGLQEEETEILINREVKIIKKKQILAQESIRPLEVFSLR